MAVSVVMPALEMAQETGKLVSWRKKEGERVSKGEMLLEVETDKAVVEVEAQAEGILAGISAKIGDVVPVGQTIAWLVAPGESPRATKAPAPTQCAASGLGRTRRIGQLDRSSHGRAHDPELDDRPSLLRHARGRWQRAHRRPRKVGTGD